MRLYDFHTHTSLSDGSLSPIELIRRAQVNGYAAVALTDHVGLASLERIIRELAADCALARDNWGIMAIPGVELTHVPAAAVAEAAQKAKQLGAWLVVVHGETVVEPVERGTNRAAIECPFVDILAHPGLLTPEDARLAAKNNTFIELSSRRGHCLTNGRIAQLARQFGLQLVVNSDAHSSDDLFSAEIATAVALGAGLDEEESHRVLNVSPPHLLEKLAISHRGNTTI